MLVLNHSVPNALILPEPPADLQSHLKAQGAHWFTAQPEALETTENGAVSALHSVTTDAKAKSTQPNKNHSRLTENGLAFIAGTHCGFVAQNLALDGANWSCAFRFKADQNDAKTLFTVNPDKADTYVFLQQSSGQLIFKDQNNTQEIVLPAPVIDGPLAVIAGLSQGRLSLQVAGSAPQQGTGADLQLAGSCELFIGCRSNKPRLLKTLGAFSLRDLVFWPDQNILDPIQDDLIAALQRSQVWRAAS